jgi:citrate lyase subunit beta / citryl-CoA lyase
MTESAQSAPGPLAPRSWLFVPATRATEWLTGAVSSGAEALILDLEDAVPAAGKQRARAELATVLARPRRQPCYVRVNATPALLWGDIAAALAAGCDGIVIPKVETPATVEQIGSAIDSSSASGHPSGHPADGGMAVDSPTPRVGILALVESARGVLAAAEIARSHERVVGLALGGEDLAADLGVMRSAAGLELSPARGLVVLAATAARRWAIDTPCTHLDRPEQLRRESQLARRMGFAGKLAIHPRQVETINTCFAPTRGEIQIALRILGDLRGTRGEAEGVSSLEGRMVDAAVVRAARRTLARARERPGRADATGAEEDAD